MKHILRLFLLALFCFSCEPEIKLSGEIIPNKKDILSLLNDDKVKNQQVISYLNGVINNTKSPHLHYLQALYYYNSQQYKKANINIQQSLQSSQSDVDYLFLAGSIAFDLENYSLANNYFKRIKTNNVTKPSLYFAMAEVSLKLNNYKLAIYYLGKIKLNDLSTKDQFYYLVLKNSNVSFLNDFKLIFESDPRYLNDFRLHRLYLGKNFDYMSKVIYQKQLLSLINQHPNDPHLLRFWARFLSKMGQKKMAELTYQKVFNLFEHNEPLNLEISKFYILNHNFNSALLYLNDIKFGLDGDMEVPILKSYCYLKLGNKNRSKLLLDSAQTVFNGDYRFYQIKKKYFRISLDSSLWNKDSLSTIER